MQANPAIKNLMIEYACSLCVRLFSLSGSDKSMTAFYQICMGMTKPPVKVKCELKLPLGAQCVNILMQ